MSKQFHLYAVKDDLITVLRQIEASEEVEYVQIENYLTEKAKIYESLIMYEELGINTTGKQEQGVQFLVTKKNHSIRFDKVSRNDGSTVFLVHQRNNPDSIIISPGGLYEDNCIIAGNIATISGSNVSMKLYSNYVKQFKKNFTCIHQFWIGEQAKKILHNGGRLTTGINRPLLYDLKKN